MSNDESYRTLKSLQKHVTLYLRKNEYNLNDDLIQYRDHQSGSFYSVDKQQVDIQEATDDTVITIRIVQDPIIDQYERSSFTFLEMTGRLGGLYEVLTVVASLMISGIVQKLFTLSVLKNLYYVEKEHKATNDNRLHVSHMNTIHKEHEITISKRVNKIKVDSIEDNYSSMIEGSHVESNQKNNKWYKNETSKENIDFSHHEPNSIQNKVLHKLSLIKKYTPGLKDYLYTISKTVR